MYVIDKESIDYQQLVPKIGFEPTLSCEKGSLSPPRLPFRHLGRKRRRNENSIHIRALPLSYHLHVKNGQADWI